MRSVWRREPVAVINGIVAIVEAGIAVAVGFGLAVTAEQTALLMALVVAIGALVKTGFQRREVTPVADPRDNDGTALVRVDSVPA